MVKITVICYEFSARNTKTEIDDYICSFSSIIHFNFFVSIVTVDREKSNELILGHYDFGISSLVTICRNSCPLITGPPN